MIFNIKILQIFQYQLSPVLLALVISIIPFDSSEAQNKFIEMGVVLKSSNTEKISSSTFEYKKSGEANPLSFNIYLPDDLTHDSNFPVVILIKGYPDSVMIKQFGAKSIDIEMYTSWARLLAANGLAAITYETQEPFEDLIDLLKFLERNCDSLKADSERIGIFSVSGNVPTALEFLSSEYSRSIKCAAFLYGFMDTPNSRFVSEIDSLSKLLGFYFPKTRPDVKIFKTPLFIVRSGRDHIPILNNLIDNFITEAMLQNSPITFINYKYGQHAFDIIDDTEESREIIRHLLKWIRNKIHSG